MNREKTISSITNYYKETGVKKVFVQADNDYIILFYHSTSASTKNVIHV